MRLFLIFAIACLIAASFTAFPIIALPTLGFILGIWGYVFIIRIRHARIFRDTLNRF